MVLADKRFCGSNNVRAAKPRYSPRDNSRSYSNVPRYGQRARTCFNYGDKNYFISDCHFERR
jgi:hypothetical protein